VGDAIDPTDVAASGFARAPASIAAAGLPPKTLRPFRASMYTKEPLPRIADPRRPSSPWRHTCTQPENGIQPARSARIFGGRSPRHVLTEQCPFRRATVCDAALVKLVNRD
jgi:hypothetical protein